MLCIGSHARSKIASRVTGCEIGIVMQNQPNCILLKTGPYTANSLLIYLSLEWPHSHRGLEHIKCRAESVTPNLVEFPPGGDI